MRVFMVTLVSRNVTCYSLGDSMEVFAFAYLPLRDRGEGDGGSGEIGIGGRRGREGGQLC